MDVLGGTARHYDNNLGNSPRRLPVVAELGQAGRLPISIPSQAFRFQLSTVEPGNRVSASSGFDLGRFTSPADQSHQLQTSLISEGQTVAMPWLAILGVVLWAIGLLFESIGDIQLARFKADQANEGKVLDRGLWKYTRHPNYFGDFVVWWGLSINALALGAPLWTLVGPLVMSVLLMRVSGVTLLESALRERKPGYREYVLKTSAFFPKPPLST